MVRVDIQQGRAVYTVIKLTFNLPFQMFTVTAVPLFNVYTEEEKERENREWLILLFEASSLSVDQSQIEIISRLLSSLAVLIASL